MQLLYFAYATSRKGNMLYEPHNGLARARLWESLWRELATA